jgi:hypothetical protein
MKHGVAPATRNETPCGVDACPLWRDIRAPFESSRLSAVPLKHAAFPYAESHGHSSTSKSRSTVVTNISRRPHTARCYGRAVSGGGGIPSRQDDADDETITHDCGRCRGVEPGRALRGLHSTLPQGADACGSNGFRQAVAMSNDGITVST